MRFEVGERVKFRFYLVGIPKLAKRWQRHGEGTVIAISPDYPSPRYVVMTQTQLKILEENELRKLGEDKRTGTPMETRFWSKVDKNGPIPTFRPDLGRCWAWSGARNSEGYGNFAIKYRQTERAHRVAFHLTRGPIPEGLTIDHLCRVHWCVNPDHLEAVSNRENIIRGCAARAAEKQREAPGS